jgi:1,4-dihydroxy-2-naphthoyl-CoA hydrolase
MSRPFSYPYIIGLFDTDAAGVIFYANLFRICQQSLEALLADIGYGLPILFSRRTMGLPIVHAESDYLHPLTVGMPVEISCHVAEIGESAYKIHYEVHARGGELMAKAATIQVCVDPKTGKSMPLPDDFRRALETYLVRDEAKG